MTIGWETHSHRESDSPAFIDRWDAATAVAPESVSGEIGTVAETARTISASIAQSRTIQGDSNLAQFTQLRAGSTLPAFLRSHCS